VKLAWLVVLALAPAAVALAQPNDDIARLAWLGGCWQADGGERGSVEQWLPLAGDTLLGVGRTVRQGRTVAHEFMQIRRGADGMLAFHAHPSGQQPAAFPVKSLSDTEVVFESLQHDFPHRVVYAVEAGGTKLKARIEGVRGGHPRVVPFPMTRVSCDALVAPGR
jgi:hypothetical protein